MSERSQWSESPDLTDSHQSDTHREAAILKAARLTKIRSEVDPLFLKLYESNILNTSPFLKDAQSSQLAELLWTDPGIKSGISMPELISTKKKKKKG